MYRGDNTVNHSRPCVLYCLCCVCVALFYACFFPNVTETDDYAEIVDEEDTYTMPSSESFIQSSPLLK